MNLKNKTNEYNKTETDSDTENKLMVTNRKRYGKTDKIGEGDQEVQTTRYEISNLQWCNGKHREYSQYFIAVQYGVYSIKLSNHYVVLLKLI